MVHNLVLVPVVLAVGLAVRRFVPTPFRAVVQAGLLRSAIVILYALPLVLGLGSTGGNETILPRDYGGGLLVVVAVIWATTFVAGLAVVVVVAHRRRE